MADTPSHKSTCQDGADASALGTAASGQPTAVETAAAGREPVKKTPRRYRVFYLREFILETFGREELQSNGGAVLDVAGGKGDLSWLLTNADGINAVVVGKEW